MAGVGCGCCVICCVADLTSTSKIKPAAIKVASVKMKYDTRLWNEDSWSSNLNYIVVDFVVDMANNKSNTIMLCVQRFFDFINMDIVNRCESRWEHRGDEGLGVVQGRCAVINEKSYADLCNIMNDLRCKGVIDKPVMPLWLMCYYYYLL